MRTLQVSFKKGMLFLMLLSCGVFILHAQSPQQDKKAEKKAMIRNMVDSQYYVFIAQSAMPMSGQTRQLTSEYTLLVSRTVIESYLPYYGRAYAAPVDPGEGGIKFTSKDFDYTTTSMKNGRWSILIKPKDYRDVQQLTLSISEDGYASLQVTCTSKQPISFNGIITAPRKKKGK